MKLIHLADLHIGRRVNEFSLLEDQKHILGQILNICAEINPDGMVIAGDVYDKTIPAAEAVELLDEFLTELAGRHIPCWVVSGNHDSAERIAFGSRIMAGQGVHLAPVFDGTMRSTTISDEYGKVDIYLLPFIKPALVRRFYPEAEIDSLAAAVRTVLANHPLAAKKRNILVAHQFVTAGGMEPERSDSESISVGGVDNVDASVFAGFDYVALGHLHCPQAIGREVVRYAGSPLKYSFSEVRQTKSVTVVELGEKGDIRIDTIALNPRRDMRRITGPIERLLSPATYSGTNTGDYLQVTLTDEEEIVDAMGKLRSVYPNVMQLGYDNSRSRARQEIGAATDIGDKSPFQLFEEFYQMQTGTGLEPEQSGIVSRMLDQVGGGGQ
ncbi:MAG: exonuclease SbcCD subunit D [Syntrophomonadaceae bacterium]